MKQMFQTGDAERGFPFQKLPQGSSQNSIIFMAIIFVALNIWWREATHIQNVDVFISVGECGMGGYI
jgi:hypothetical protein